jgi:hypothetical protein
MSQQPRALLDQIQDILARYRNLDEKDKGAMDAFAKMIADSGLPSYHKEVLVVALLTPQDGETVLTLSLLRQQEQLRHTEALLNIERRVLEERITKRQSR